jgi:hypothetical protein
LLHTVCWIQRRGHPHVCGEFVGTKRPHIITCRMAVIAAGSLFEPCGCGWRPGHCALNDRPAASETLIVCLLIPRTFIITSSSSPLISLDIIVTSPSSTANVTRRRQRASRPLQCRPPIHRPHDRKLQRTAVTMHTAKSEHRPPRRESLAPFPVFRTLQHPHPGDRALFNGFQLPERPSPET